MKKSYRFQDLFSALDLERLMKEVNILLISDLHFDKTKFDPKTKTNLADEINAKLVSSIENLAKSNSDWQPDIVIVAGDLVNQGKAEAYDYYFSLIEKLVKSFPALKNAIFSTPGNHDINRENIVSAYQYLYSAKKNNPKLKNKNSFTSSEIVNTLYTVSQFNLDDPDKKKLKKFLSDFENEYFKTYLEKQKELETKKIINIIDKKFPYNGLKTTYIKDVLGIRIASVNSSFFCNFSGLNDRNNLFYITDVVSKVANFLIESPYPVITFMHHPYYYMHESEYIYPINSENNNFNKLAECSDIILSGHVHGELHEPSIVYQKVYTITNGTTFTNDKIEDKCFPFTYALIKVNKQLDKFKVKKYKYNSTTLEFEAIKNKNLYYSFQEKNKKRKTSSELEKINIIKYLLNTISKPSGFSLNEYRNEIILTQLKLYAIEVKIHKRNIFFSRYLGLNCLRLNAYSNPILIAKIDAGNISNKIFNFLTKLNNEKIRPLVFFAINISQISSNQEDLPSNLDDFILSLKSAILKSKYDLCQLNFLYYQ
ncbi:metallophosphoesterase family protein [Ferruginibacter albus]|uniref:metallophosphoesterase family protein n=1 Tax=Ferruginibacter albus TaxID=2875540 RepID=UPI001CC5D6F6|nr:metallophosphoesterase [Ferruginibacter albus]UAY51299.1 metallophosphoesterase [Ferruginibacter albus]